MNGEPSIQCWSCKAHVTLDDRGDADGNCPKCRVELDLEEYLRGMMASSKTNLENVLSTERALRHSMAAEIEHLKKENALLSGPAKTVTVCEKGKPFSFMAQDPCRFSLCEVTYARPVYTLIAERNNLKEIASKIIHYCDEGQLPDHLYNALFDAINPKKEGV